jgi:hypothetical protein
MVGSVTAQIADTEIIGKDENDIRRFGRGRERAALKSEQRDDEQSDADSKHIFH